MVVRALPDRFGRYRVLRRLAGGGMAEVFLAVADDVDGCARPVVIKRILPGHASDLEAVHLFVDEARVLSCLSHHNIVDFYGLELIHGEYFMVLEYLPGADTLRILRTALQAGRQVPLDAAIAVGIRACAGLHHAHERRGADGQPLAIVHRDISPANICVTFGGGVKLIDFGVAKSEPRTSHARQRTIKGKISYLSPEQARGEAVDRRSDLFSLSIVLWELTTGTKLFYGANDYEVLKSILDGETRRPSRVVADYPDALEAIVMKGLERDRERRYQTAEEMQRDLERFAVEERMVVSSRAPARLMRELFVGLGQETNRLLPVRELAAPRAREPNAPARPWDGREAPSISSGPSPTTTLPRVATTASITRPLKITKPPTVATTLDHGTATGDRTGPAARVLDLHTARLARVIGPRARRRLALGIAGLCAAIALVASVWSARRKSRATQAPMATAAPATPKSR